MLLKPSIFYYFFPHSPQIWVCLNLWLSAVGKHSKLQVHRDCSKSGHPDYLDVQERWLPPVSQR